MVEIIHNMNRACRLVAANDFDHNTFIIKTKKSLMVIKIDHNDIESYEVIKKYDYKDETLNDRS